MVGFTIDHRTTWAYDPDIRRGTAPHGTAEVRYDHAVTPAEQPDDDPARSTSGGRSTVLYLESMPGQNRQRSPRTWALGGTLLVLGIIAVVASFVVRSGSQDFDDDGLLASTEVPGTVTVSLADGGEYVIVYEASKEHTGTQNGTQVFVPNIGADTITVAGPAGSRVRVDGAEPGAEPARVRGLRGRETVARFVAPSSGIYELTVRTHGETRNTDEMALVATAVSQDGSGRSAVLPVLLGVAGVALGAAGVSVAMARRPGKQRRS